MRLLSLHTLSLPFATGAQRLRSLFGGVRPDLSARLAEVAGTGVPETCRCTASARSDDDALLLSSWSKSQGWKNQKKKAEKEGLICAA